MVTVAQEEHHHCSPSFVLVCSVAVPSVHIDEKPKGASTKWQTRFSRVKSNPRHD